MRGMAPPTKGGSACLRLDGHPAGTCHDPPPAKERIDIPVSEQAFIRHRPVWA